MKILVAWDVPAEADLLALYLSGGGENEVALAQSPDDVLGRLQQQAWDVVFVALSYPETVDQGFALFTRISETLEGAPLVMACRPQEMISLPRFLIRGLRYYLYRDPQ